jgi:hypothetical protein
MRVARGNCRVFVGQLFRAVHHAASDGKHLQKQLTSQIIDLLTLSPTAQRPVTMDDFLQDFRVDASLDLTDRHVL